MRQLLPVLLLLGCSGKTHVAAYTTQESDAAAIIAERDAEVPADWWGPIICADAGCDAFDSEDAAARAKSLPRPECPDQPPLPGAMCSGLAAACGYGDQLDGACRSRFDCVEGQWFAAIVPVSSGCGKSKDDCPVTRPEFDSACEIDRWGPFASCAYGNIRCYCRNGIAVDPGIAGTWFCEGPPPDLACPAKLPNVGEGCDHQGVSCFYDIDGCSGAANFLFCRHGAWEVGAGLGCY